MRDDKEFGPDGYNAYGQCIYDDQDLMDEPNTPRTSDAERKAMMLKHCITKVELDELFPEVVGDYIRMERIEEQSEGHAPYYDVAYDIYDLNKRDEYGMGFECGNLVWYVRKDLENHCQSSVGIYIRDCDTNNPTIETFSGPIKFEFIDDTKVIRISDGSTDIINKYEVCFKENFIKAAKEIKNLMYSNSEIEL